jgi:hypothetical protein
VRVTECLCNPLQHSFDILHYLVVPEAQYAIAFLCQKSSPSSILLHLRGMLTPIQFHDQATFRAAEVGDEATDRMLSPELCAV